MSEQSFSGETTPIEQRRAAFAVRGAYNLTFDAMRKACSGERAIDVPAESTRRMRIANDGKRADLASDNQVAMKERPPAARFSPAIVAPAPDDARRRRRGAGNCTAFSASSPAAGSPDRAFAAAARIDLSYAAKMSENRSNTPTEHGQFTL